ncbi:hypothetical protein [Nocardioides convexus]|uniref:hypothetical protein n=1 Tax=Nocardioides convexus TaxID=2712224 RepID=UPI002418169A|nr:hypothetical protein [Nocardioides convexus]
MKALRKPSTAAWVLNLLVRREGAQVDQVLNVGAALRQAQQAMSAGEPARAHQAAPPGHRRRDDPGPPARRRGGHPGHRGRRRAGRGDADRRDGRRGLWPGGAQRAARRRAQHDRRGGA